MQMKYTAGALIAIVLLTMFNLYIYMGNNNENELHDVNQNEKLDKEDNYNLLRINFENNMNQKMDELQKELESNFKIALKETLNPFASILNSLDNKVDKDFTNQQYQLQQIIQQENQILVNGQQILNQENQILTHEQEIFEKQQKETTINPQINENNLPNEPIKCPEVTEKLIFQRDLNWDKEMEKLDWNVVEKAAKTNNHELPEEWVTQYLELTIPFLEEVKGPLINTTAPELEINCKKKEYSHFLTGNKRKQPIRIFDLTEMAYELDILEIRLFELEDVVDEFVLLEGLYTHIGIKKPLFFERNYQRYSRWKDKIKYIVWDERMSLESDRLNEKKFGKYDWSLEKKSRSFLMEAFKELHRDGEDLNDEDLLILGDLDELPHRDVIAHFKYCEVKENFFPATFDAIFWRFSFHWLFNEICDCPSVVTWKNIKKENVPLRENFSSRIGTTAWHLNRFGPAVMQVVKEFSIAEGSLQLPSGNPEILRNISFAQQQMEKGIRPCCPRDHLAYHKDPIQEGYAIPWIILANQHSSRWNFL